MKLMLNLKSFMLLSTFALSSQIYAESTHWSIDSAKSNLTFTATQNNAPVSGQFKKVEGKIDFDPKQLDQSKVNLSVDMNSITLAFKELEEVLKTSDWFDTKAYPKATFKSTQIKKSENNNYQAMGELQLKNKTIPLTILFDIPDYSQNAFHAKGSTEIKRTAFGIGQGEWSDTTDVKDNVKVDFNLALTPEKH